MQCIQVNQRACRWNARKKWIQTKYCYCCCLFVIVKQTFFITSKHSVYLSSELEAMDLCVYASECKIWLLTKLYIEFQYIFGISSHWELHVHKLRHFFFNVFPNIFPNYNWFSIIFWIYWLSLLIEWKVKTIVSKNTTKT